MKWSLSPDKTLSLLLILVGLALEIESRRSRKPKDEDVLAWLLAGNSGPRKDGNSHESEEVGQRRGKNEEPKGKDIPPVSRQRTCTIDIYADQHLWNDFFLTKAGLNRNRVEGEIREFVNELIAGVNRIYKPVNFRGIRGINFKLRNLKVYDDLSCWKLGAERENPFCGGALNIEHYFEQHISRDFSDVITHQALHFRRGRRALGTANTATLGGFSGICGSYFEREDSPGNFFSSNAGVITTSFSGRRLTQRETISLLAHELGHSLGSDHDDNSDCRSGSHLMRGNDYLSFVDLDDLEEESDILSTCSIAQISEVLGEILSVKANQIIPSGEKYNCFTR